MGRWLSRDSIEETGGVNLVAFDRNNGVNAFDFLGLLLTILENKPKITRKRQLWHYLKLPN